MKKNKADSFYDFLLFLFLGIYVLSIFILRRLVSKTFNFVYIKYNFNILLFILSIIVLVIDLCFLLSRLKSKNKKNTKKITKKDKWSKEFIILFRSFFCVSVIIIVLSVVNTVFSRYELDTKSVKKYNLFNKVVKEEQLDSYNSISVIPSYYTGKQGNSFRILIKLRGNDNLTFMYFYNRKKMLSFLQALKKMNNVLIDRSKLEIFYSENVVYWDNEERKIFEDFFLK